VRRCGWSDVHPACGKPDQPSELIEAHPEAKQAGKETATDRQHREQRAGLAENPPRAFFQAGATPVAMPAADDQQTGDFRASHPDRTRPWSPPNDPTNVIKASSAKAFWRKAFNERTLG